MPTPLLKPVNPRLDRQTLIELSHEYMAWVADGVARHFGAAQPKPNAMPLAGHVARSVDALCNTTARQGVIYLVELDGQAAGIGGLRRLDDSTAEVKRFYIRPQNRGQKLGSLLLQQLLIDAQLFGYQRVLLDSAPFMRPAQALYEAAGFQDCAAYEASEVPAALRAGWRFMEKPLTLSAGMPIQAP